MAAAIRGERPPRLGRSDALGQARTIAALYESAAQGVAVRPNGIGRQAWSWARWLVPRWDRAMAEQPRHDEDRDAGSSIDTVPSTLAPIRSLGDAARRWLALGRCPTSVRRCRSRNLVPVALAGARTRGADRGPTLLVAGSGHGASDVLGSPGGSGTIGPIRLRSIRRHTRADDRDVPSGFACPRVARGPSPGRPRAPGRTAFERPRRLGPRGRARPASSPACSSSRMCSSSSRPARASSGWTRGPTGA